MLSPCKRILPYDKLKNEPSLDHPAIILLRDLTHHPVHLDIDFPLQPPTTESPNTLTTATWSRWPFQPSSACQLKCDYSSTTSCFETPKWLFMTFLKNQHIHCKQTLRHILHTGVVFEKTRNNVSACYSPTAWSQRRPQKSFSERQGSR